MLPAQPNRSLMDGIRCLQILAANPGPIGARELARRLNMETTRAHRLVKTLAHMGMARQNRNSKYMPGPAMQVMAAQSLYSSGLIGNTTKSLLDLHKRLNLLTAFGMLWERNVYYLYHLMPGMSPEEAVSCMRLQPVTQSGIGMMLLSKKTDEEVREFFDGVDEIPAYTGGVEMVIDELHKIRKRGYAFVEMHTGNNEFSLATMSPNNLYTGVALGGAIEEGRIPELLEELNKALVVMFPKAP
ncbi:MAG: helix-turn-helix domain-containing protein [Verrucomicrobia bacterium]|nr:helix-turn-helix domain-containing protein [Verrucomicrobiota bacterium]MDA1067453.1 helix-turn-helix domain-containing protein [Verrucomicrobiota bacterium]